jgi:uncharacterized Zn-finger protein
MICFKSFALAQYLKEHTYIHTGQKPFTCEHPGCGRQFRQAGKLSMHRKIHQNIIFTISKVKRKTLATTAALPSPQTSKVVLSKLALANSHGHSKAVSARDDNTADEEATPCSRGSCCIEKSTLSQDSSHHAHVPEFKMAKAKANKNS